MKLRIFTFLLIAAAGLSACKKDGQDFNINQYDQQQIEKYMSANGLTDFQRDVTEGDSSGIYYKIINKGTGEPLEYSDLVSIVYTIKSFDGKYVYTDTIVNHHYEYLGHFSQTTLPIAPGLQTAIHNLLKYRDGSMRVLIPSRLAFGKAGYGTGSVTNANTRIAGNQSLEYYVHVIDNQQVYDDMVIQNYMKANSLSGYTKNASGLYYKIISPGTGTTVASEFSTITTTYTGSLLNNVLFDESAKTTATSFTVSNLVDGVKEGITKYGKEGASISLIMPSYLGYGTGGNGTLIRSNYPLKFEFQIATVTN
jgi:FKBP-type peptidyl-prolyl cis-trans isomerase FkpA